MIDAWWREAEKHNVLPLDDRFGPRFAENAARFHGARTHFTFHHGMGHVPTDVAPDVRSRNYTIEAHVEIAPRRGRRADRARRRHLGLQPLHQGRPADARHQHRRPAPDHRLRPQGAVRRLPARPARQAAGPHRATGHGGADRRQRLHAADRGRTAGSLQTQIGFNNFISWSGLDIGRDRGSPVSHYAAPFEFTGRLLRVHVTMHDDQQLDGDGIGQAEMARQ